MKILVTVGTTPFDLLIETIDGLACDFPDIQFTAQISSGVYEPKHMPWVRFVPDILDQYPDSLVLTHCGAGTVFSLLDANRKFVAIPNLTRVDHHQVELAQVLQESQLAIVALSMSDLRDIFINQTYKNFCASEYQKTPFFKASEIRAMLFKSNVAITGNSQERANSPIEGPMHNYESHSEYFESKSKNQ